MGLFDFLKPTQSIVPGKVVDDPRVGALQMAPQMGPQEGFLDRLRKPDDNGVSFADRLFAAGGVARGDSDGAMNYLNTIRDKAVQAQKDQRAQGLLKQRSAAFKAAMASGSFDPAVYAQMADAAFDPSDVAALDKVGKPHYQFLEQPDGGVSVGNPDTGDVQQRIAPGPHREAGYYFDPVTKTARAIPGGPADPAVIQANALQRRRVIVDNPTPQRARAGGKAKSYDAGEVKWQ